MKKIINHLRENWIRHAFETLVVVVGILVAFTLTNWNEGRKNAMEEQVILKLLYDDFQNSKTHSEDLINREFNDIQILAAALGTSDQVDSLFSLPDNQQVAKTIFWDFQHEAPVFRGYMDLKNSGKSSTINSQELRAELTQLEEKISLLEYYLEDRRTVHTMRMDAISVENLNYLPIINRDGLDIIEGQPTDYLELLKDQRIRNLLAIKLELGAGILAARKDLNDQIVQVLESLKKEIK